MIEQPDQGQNPPADDNPESAVEEFDLVERLQEGGHIVICNWNMKGTAIVKELHSDVNKDEQRLIVIVTDKQLPTREGEHWRGVFTIEGNPLDTEFLLQAMIRKAHSAIILADEEAPNPDTTNFMLAASIEKISKNVHTIVEISQSSYLAHFQGTGVDEMICISEIAEKIISQSCLTHGLSDLYLHLLTASQDTNEIYIVPAPKVTHGRTYREVRHAIGKYDSESLVILGFLSQVNGNAPEGNYNIFKRNGKEMIMIVNPQKNHGVEHPFTQQYVIQPGDELIFIALEQPKLPGFTM